jgi:hypothetical protein
LPKTKENGIDTNGEPDERGSGLYLWLKYPFRLKYIHIYWKPFLESNKDKTAIS